MRRVQLDGCFNFRDLGGYPAAGGRAIRWGHLYRSDSLHLLTPRDVAILCDDLCIREVIDLRSTGELRADGRGLIAERPVRFHHVPLFDGPVLSRQTESSAMNLADRYFLLAEFAKAPIARTIEIIASAQEPVLYHCAAGKDRTGVISAVLLGLLGIEDEVIVADYALSSENLELIVERLMSNESYQTMLTSLPPDTLHADPETMRTLLRRLRSQYGTMENYARSAGLATETIERLKTRLLD